MIRASRLRPLLSAAIRTLNPTHTPHCIPPQTASSSIPSSFRTPFPTIAPPHQFIQRSPVSGTPKGKARLKSVQALKKKSFVQKKGKGSPEDLRKGGKGPLATKPRPVILRLNDKRRRREAEREKLGLVSKLRKREVEIQKVRAAADAAPDKGPTLMGPPGMTLTSLGLVDADVVPKYRLTVEDGRRLAKEYSRLLMRWERERQVAENGLMELRKEAIEALPENLRRAALMPIQKKKKDQEDEGADKKKVPAKGKGKTMAGKRPGTQFGKKGAGKGTKKG